jgi:phosphatidylglycerophosphate synthase
MRPLAVADHERALKPVDSWWTVFAVDPLAMRVLPTLLRVSWLTPNVVTGVAFVVGGVSVALFATGHLVAGALVYELRFFLDCLDGKIARVQGSGSLLGAAFDRLADAFTIPAAYAAIGWTLAERHSWSHTLVLAVALLAALVTLAELSLDAIKRDVAATASGAPTSREGVTGWMRRRRLTLRPWTVEAETIGLFLGPLVLRGHLLADLQLGVAAVYALFVAIDVGLMLRVARTVQRDRHPGAADQLRGRP